MGNVLHKEGMERKEFLYREGRTVFHKVKKLISDVYDQSKFLQRADTEIAHRETVEF